MSDLRQQLRSVLHGRVCLVGMGNVDCGDDGFGVRLAERLAACRGDHTEILIARANPERCVCRLMDGGFDNVLFLDAVECGASGGAAVLLGAREMASHFPQITTHKISLGLLSSLIEDGGRTSVWLLGVQPESLAWGNALSPQVQTSLDALAELLKAELETRVSSEHRPGHGPPSQCEVVVC